MKTNNKTLILFTHVFPDSSVAESFIDLEMPHLASAFGKVIIVPLERPKHGEVARRSLPHNVIADRSLAEACAANAKAAYYISKSVLSFWAISDLLRRPRLIGISALKRLFGHLSVAFKTRDWTLSFLDTNKMNPSDVVLYSYWLGASTHGLTMAKKARPGLRVVSRAHGWDLYEERAVPPYLPLRNEILSGIDCLFLVSNDGKKYISERYPGHVGKLHISRLGVNGPHCLSSPSDDGIVRIVSCSYIVPIKRLDLLIRGLAELGKARPAMHFEWTHIGNGPLEDDIRELATTLPTNVGYNLIGKLENRDVLRYYCENHIDLFINVSSSEGIPVSIMEAQSAGIPVVATAVGGTPEIVSDEVGVLMSSNPSPKEISEAIAKLVEQPGFMKKQQMARANFESRYNANVNFSSFAQALTNL